MFLYLAGSVTGIALLVALSLMLFGRVQPSVGSVAEVTARLAREVPGFRLGNFALARDGRTALIEDANEGAIYLVEAMGDQVVTRKLTRALLRCVARDGSKLSLALADFTLPRAAISLETDALAGEWQARLAI